MMNIAFFKDTFAIQTPFTGGIQIKAPPTLPSRFVFISHFLYHNLKI